MKPRLLIDSAVLAFVGGLKKRDRDFLMARFEQIRDGPEDHAGVLRSAGGETASASGAAISGGSGVESQASSAARATTRASAMRESLRDIRRSACRFA